jgi:hypothetical protein
VKWILIPHVRFGSWTFSNLVTGRKEKHGLIGTKWKGKAQQAEDKCQLYADVFLIAAEILSLSSGFVLLDRGIYGGAID